jgi:hypothetical protein
MGVGDAAREQYFAVKVDQGLDQGIALALVLGLDMKYLIAVLDIGVITHVHGFIIKKNNPPVKNRSC